MPLTHYGVLKGRPIQRRLGITSSPHYQVHMIDEITDYRIAINVGAEDPERPLEYLIDEDFHHPITGGLHRLPLGFTPLLSAPGTSALDYIRHNLFDPSRMRPLPFDIPGPDNDLNEKIDRHIQRALAEEDALIYAFGDRWGPLIQHRDPIFGFEPGNGIHDIHMNQGNDHRFQGQDGIYQDGAVLIHFPSSHQWVAIFLKFQPQTWHTTEPKGHRIDALPPLIPNTSDLPRDGLVRIVAALINPIGSDTNRETVTLINTSPYPIDLTDWSLCDRKKHPHPLQGILPPGETRRITLHEPVQLGNKGGLITLLDYQGIRVHGVAYTRVQAEVEGWTVVF